MIMCAAQLQDFILEKNSQWLPVSNFIWDSAWSWKTIHLTNGYDLLPSNDLGRGRERQDEEESVPARQVSRGGVDSWGQTENIM